MYISSFNQIYQCICKAKAFIKILYFQALFYVKYCSRFKNFPRTPVVVSPPALGVAFGANCYFKFPVDAPVRKLPRSAPVAIYILLCGSRSGLPVMQHMKYREYFVIYCCLYGVLTCSRARSKTGF